MASHPPIFNVRGSPAERATSTRRRSSSGRVPSASNSALTLTTPCDSLPFSRISTIFRSVRFIDTPTRPQ